MVGSYSYSYSYSYSTSIITAYLSLFLLLLLSLLIARDLPGYAIGGLSGGESKDMFWRIVDQCTSALPKDKPRYLMGVGYAVDLVVCSALGVDMFDCVYPSRTG